MSRSFTVLALAIAFAAQAQPAGDLNRAIELPAAAQQLRDKGVPPNEVSVAVNAAKDHGLSAGEATDVLEEGAKGEKIDNFGKFVNEQLEKGLRGRELAQAIHEEKAKKGKGPDGEGPPGQEEGKTGKGKAPDGEGGEPGGGNGEGEGKAGKGKSGKGGH